MGSKYDWAYARGCMWGVSNFSFEIPLISVYPNSPNTISKQGYPKMGEIFVEEKMKWWQVVWEEGSGGLVWKIDKDDEEVRRWRRSVIGMVCVLIFYWKKIN